MYKKLISFVGLLMVLSSYLCVAQKVSVDPLTGTGGVVIPICTVSQGQVSAPVTLMYTASGVKLKDVESTAGMNWSLHAGGSISRVVRGLPDDITKDNLGNNMYGWMSTLDTGASAIASFPITNNGSTCTNETADISYINSHFPYRDDTEPDEFYVNAPGLSCQLIYSRDSAKFIPVSYQDLVITYTVVGGTGNNNSTITSFTITNDKGVTYVFGNAESITQKSYGTPTYYKNQYLQYQNGITYNDNWNLTTITDPNGNGVRFSYEAVPQTTGSDSTALYLMTSSSYSLQYRVSNIINSQRLTSISTVNVNATVNRVNLYWTIPTIYNGTGQTIIDSLTANGVTYNFNYDPVQYIDRSFSRNFLRSFTSSGCGSPVNISFGYVGEYKNGFTYTPLPDSSSVKRDYWGYYSEHPNTNSLMPKVWMAGINHYIQPVAIWEANTGAVDIYPYYTTNANASDRRADSVNVMTASLNKIRYGQGGSTTIIYESNDYRDVPSGNVVKGGGIRVKQIIDSVTVGSNTAMVRNYTYINPTTGLSSGKPVSLPTFGFMIPYSGSLANGNLYNYITALSAYDLSSEDHTIMYEYSKVSQSGAGYTQYQYYVPATNWDASATPACHGCTTADWAPTINYIGRNDCTATYGPVGTYTNTYTYSYPFVSNQNYDFERGQLLKVSNYNDNPTPLEVSETTYTYQRSYTPTYTYGFRWEDDPNGTLLVKGYGRYKFFYHTSELTDTATTKVFDSSGSGTYRQTKAVYTYGSPYHKLLTEEQATNSDNSVVTTNTRYLKDYAPNASTNANINAMYQLRQQNVNAPVETWSQVTRGATTVTTAASLTLFNKYTVGSTTHYLPSQQWKLAKPAGQSTFLQFSINTGTATIALDTGYFQTANFDTYDDTGFPLTVDDSYKNYVTALHDFTSNYPTATFKNAQCSEVAFSDFDSQFASPVNTFTISGGSGSVNGHTGNGYNLTTTCTLTANSVSRNPAANNYIFSVWVNTWTVSSTVTLTLTVTIGGTPTIYTKTVSPTHSNWQYCELKLPVSGSSFSVAVQSNTDITVDDLLLYPETAEAASVAYDPISHYKTAVTNTNGISTYFQNDKWGRTLYVLNQDKNILQKNTYVTDADIADFTPSISPSSAYVNTPTAFSIGNVPACAAAGVTVTWTFGDSSSPVTTALTTSPTHTYTALGTYTLTAVVHSPLYGDKTLTSPVTVMPGNITLSYNNYLPTGNGSLTTITFKQGGVVKYTFYNYQIAGATILQGVYDITAVITNPNLRTTYSYSLTGSCDFTCNNYTASSNLTFTNTGVDLTACTTLNVALSTSNCGTPP